MFIISELSSLNFRTDWKNRTSTDVEYRQRFLPDDPIKVQFICDKSIFAQVALTLYSHATKTTRTITPVDLTPEEEYSTGKFTLPVLGLGKYDLTITVSSEEVYKCTFCIVESFEGSVLFRYDNYENDWDTVFDGPFYFRVEGMVLPADVKFNVSTEDFRTQRYDLVQLSAEPYEVQTLTVGIGQGVPNWVGRKLNYIFSCSEVFINGEGYVRSDGSAPQAETLGINNPLFLWTIDIEPNGSEAGPDLTEIKITGKVLDNITRKPIAGAQVEIFNGDDLLAAVTTSSTGEFNYIWPATLSTYPDTLTFFVAQPGYDTGRFVVGLPNYDEAAANGISEDFRLSIDSSYIEFEIDSSSGSFIVPFAGFAANNTSYSIDIYVNDQFIAKAEGVSAYSSGTGYELTGLTGPTATVMLRSSANPTSPAIGWARAFGFYGAGNFNGCNSVANKSKILRVLHDPDYAYCQTEIATGGFFRNYQYFGCLNLTIVPDESMPETIKTITNAFRWQQYYGCQSLVKAAAEYIPDGVESFGANLRFAQYYGCSSLLIGNYIHDYRFAELLNAETPTGASNFQQVFYLSATKPDPDTVPRYYTDSSRTTTAPITDLTPATRKYYLTGRGGIAGYASINANWK